MKRKILAAVVAVGLSTSLMAGYGMMKDHKGMNPMKEVMKSLDLSNEQRDALKAMRQSGFEEMKKDRQNMALNMSAYFKADGFDKEGLKNEMRNNMEARIEARAAKMESIYNILTPEQRVQFIAKMQELGQ